MATRAVTQGVQGRPITPGGSDPEGRLITSPGLHYSMLPRPEAKRALPHLPRERRLQAPALVRVFRELAERRSPWPLYLWGGVGTGKTRGVLAESDWIDWRYGIWYGSVSSLARAYGEVQLSEAGLERLNGELWRCDLVAVDELGIKAPTDHVFESLAMLADLRDRRPTIWISNLSPERLIDTYDERICSRLLCGTVLELRGKDRRIR